MPLTAAATAAAVAATLISTITHPPSQQATGSAMIAAIDIAQATSNTTITLSGVMVPGAGHTQQEVNDYLNNLPQPDLCTATVPSGSICLGTQFASLPFVTGAGARAAIARLGSLRQLLSRDLAGVQGVKVVLPDANKVKSKAEQVLHSIPAQPRTMLTKTARKVAGEVAHKVQQATDRITGTLHPHPAQG